MPPVEVHQQVDLPQDARCGRGDRDFETLFLEQDAEGARIVRLIGGARLAEGDRLVPEDRLAKPALQRRFGIRMEGWGGTRRNGSVTWGIMLRLFYAKGGSLSSSFRHLP